VETKYFDDLYSYYLLRMHMYTTVSQYIYKLLIWIRLPIIMKIRILNPGLYSFYSSSCYLPSMYLCLFTLRYVVKPLAKVKNSYTVLFRYLRTNLQAFS
jgi:hypothetical protein